MDRCLARHGHIDGIVWTSCRVRYFFRFCQSCQDAIVFCIVWIFVQDKAWGRSHIFQEFVFGNCSSLVFLGSASHRLVLPYQWYGACHVFVDKSAYRQGIVVYAMLYGI